MYTKVLLALAPIAAQAAQSARWPVFNLRANVTEQYTGYGGADFNSREYWHNAPLGPSGGGEISGPLVDKECNQRVGMNDHAPYSQPYLFYARSTTTGKYAPSELVDGSHKLQIAQKNQRDANGRRAVVVSTCGTGSTSLYITDSKPHHLAYDNKDAKKKEQFGSFYLCGSGEKGDRFGYGDALFYRSADETTPEECGEVIFYPECMPLKYTVKTTQATSEATGYDGRDVAGHYDAHCYVDVKSVTGAPNTEIMEWFNAPRTSYYPVGKIQV